MEKKYMPIIQIDRSYVCELCDAGMAEYHYEDGTIDKDDLRLSFELSGGHKILLTGVQRFYFEGNYLIIEDLV